MSAANVMPPNGRDERDNRIEVYKTIFDTWRSQVDSYWQRSNYFALFETAAVGACWHLVSGSHKLEVGAGVGLSVLGICLTFVWYRNNAKTHGYVRHWWDSMGKIEAQLNLTPNDFASQLDRKQDEEHKERGGWEYRDMIQKVPILFGVAWVALFVTAVVRLACFLCQYKCA